MRTRSMLSAVLLPAVLLVAVSCRGPGADDKGNRDHGPVRLAVSCPGNDLNVKMAPWEVGLSKSNPQAIDFVLTQSGEVSEFTLIPDKTHWPFKLPGAGSYASSGGKVKLDNPETGGVSVGDRGHYTIQLTCTSGGVAHKIVIDPDVVIEQ